MERKRVNVLITGTPGTGKSTLARKVAANLDLEFVDVTEAIKANKFFTEYDEQLDTHVLDEDALLDHLEGRLGSLEGGAILDYHSAELFPKRWFDLVVVLRCETAPLFDRLTGRGYSERKRRENMECEIFGVVADEAKEAFDESIVHEFGNSTLEEMDANVRRISELVGECEEKTKRKRIAKLK